MVTTTSNLSRVGIAKLDQLTALACLSASSRSILNVHVACPCAMVALNVFTEHQLQPIYTGWDGYNHFELIKGRNSKA